MRFEKIKLDDMERCYAASTIRAEGRTYAVFASESVDGPCYAYTGEGFSQKEVIWEKAGGTMSFVPIPGRDGEFIAVQRFFPGFQSAGAKLVWGRRGSSGWEVRDLAGLPYVHRFDLFVIEDEIHLFAAILCGSKKDREDWSDPGKILAGKLPAAPEGGVSWREISGGHVKNHGYGRGRFQGAEAAFFTSQAGLFAAVPPAKKDGEWKIVTLINRPISDVAVIDLDGDGEDELVTIEPFHGNQFVVNKKNAGGSAYEVVWRYPNDIDFAHTVTGCTLCGRQAVIGGIRRKNGELFVLLHDAGKGFYTELVEEGAGTSNAAAVRINGVDHIIAANHTKNEAAVYRVKDGNP
jgi:hypothetical protein